jgi:hypothetical protein
MPPAAVGHPVLAHQSTNEHFTHFMFAHESKKFSQESKQNQSFAK